MLLAFLLVVSLGAQERKLQVLFTAGTRACVMAEDPATLKPRPGGWVKLASVIRKLKDRCPETLLVDGGGTLQGDPLAYVRHRVHAGPDPGTAILNALGACAMGVGEHDFDFGQKTLREVEEQATYPWLAANLVVASTGKPAFTPYCVVELGGVKAAILGLSASSLAQRCIPGTFEGLRVLDAVETAGAYVKKMRDQEKADLVIVVYHGGAEELSRNELNRLAETVPGIDLILAAHAPSVLPSKGAPILNAAPFAKSVGAAELTLRRERGHWKLSACERKDFPVDATTTDDPEVLRLTQPLRKATQTYLDTVATELQVELDGRWARMEDSAILRLIHSVQRKATGAQLSIAACARSRYYVPKGPVSIRQLWPLAPGEDRVARIQLTGSQLRKWLEHSARFYAFSHQPQLFSQDVAPSDFDMLDGLNYALDISRPLGQRVTVLTHRGRAVDEKQVFTVAVSARRLAGEGGFLQAVEFKGTPDFISTQSLRNLLFAFVLAKPSLDLPLVNNWRIVPWLSRERVLAQQPD